ncbi:MAG TPA: DUF1330 domain-containing protein [Thermomicrobiales bacterium]|nr:DUF1330 domain-containing protein [Thermomicrobiales bacterium]
MAAYLIYARRQITDEEKSRQYSQQVLPSIHQYGGELVSARGAVTVLEGEWKPQSLTILKFESMERLMAWYDSDEYAPLKQMRLESNIGDVVVVEGM